jgi:uncharacterized protein
MSLLTRVAVLAVLVATAYYVLLFLTQRQLLFPRPRGPASGPSVTGSQHVQIRGPHGPVHVWFEPPGGAPAGRHPAIVFAHGNAERAEDWMGAFSVLQEAGLAVAVVEYPGYGIAEGSPTQTSITDAMIVGYDWLRDRDDVDTARIVGYGRSLGGGAVAQLAARRAVAALILESSFTSVKAFAGRFFAPGVLVRDPFDTLDVLARYRGPLLVLHGTRDEIAPPAHGRALAAAVPGAVLIPMPCGHNDCARPWPAVLTFLSENGILPAPHAGA